MKYECCILSSRSGLLQFLNIFTFIIVFLHSKHAFYVELGVSGLAGWREVAARNSDANERAEESLRALRGCYEAAVEALGRAGRVEHSLEVSNPNNHKYCIYLGRCTVREFDVCPIFLLYLDYFIFTFEPIFILLPFLKLQFILLYLLCYIFHFLPEVSPIICVREKNHNNICVECKYFPFRIILQ